MRQSPDSTETRALTPMIIVIGALLAGCASHKPPSTQPTNSYDRQEAAMKDPFGYSPDMGKNDVSGGKINEYDREGMKRDVDHVLNP